MKTGIFIIPVIILVMLSVSSRSEAQGRVDKQHITRKWLDISYADVSPAQKLDIYLPERGDGFFPVIVSIHGGAFRFGDKADGQLQPMLAGLKRGYAAEYLLNAEKIAVWGGSAGGHLAAMAGVTGGAAFETPENPDKAFAFLDRAVLEPEK